MKKTDYYDFLEEADCLMKKYKEEQKEYSFDKESQTIIQSPYSQVELSHKLDCDCNFHNKANEIYFEVIGNIHENEKILKNTELLK
ncbi:hypothetical protein DU708_07645 [Campylobacter jejuni]|nr:hypothetical protein [Campylobacter jejuni]EAL7569782.1 hypothetical protein [Campylobacter jejuni]